jgi:AbrB family looped-hinge helix DNA binding protein
MNASAKLSKKFQVTIPAAVRQRLCLKAGDVVILTLEGGEVILRAANGGWTESSCGLGAEMWKRHGGGGSAVERERDAWA